MSEMSEIPLSYLGWFFPAYFFDPCFWAGSSEVTSPALWILTPPLVFVGEVFPPSPSRALSNEPSFLGVCFLAPPFEPDRFDPREPGLASLLLLDRFDFLD